MPIPPGYIEAATVAAIFYFILIFLEDLLGINKRKRLFIAIAIGFLFYHYGDVVVRFIKTIFAAIGL